MKKKWTALFLAALLTAAPAAAGAEEETAVKERYPHMPRMALSEYPRVDGSLACLPLMEALVRAVTGCSDIEAEASLDGFSNTNPSYRRLWSGDADLILSYEAAGSTAEWLEEQKKTGENELDLREVGLDALVFLVNAGNPVEGLTREQIRGIYRGEIQSWKEVGGEDVPIKAFQRNEDSGSQTLLRLLLMGEEEIPEKEMVRISGMDGLIQTVMAYDNSANALGFSVYFYASVMMGNDSIKLLSVDGVRPGNDTIASGEYSLSNPFYVGVSSKSSPKALELRDWLLSEEGQDYVEELGYAAVH